MPRARIACRQVAAGARRIAFDHQSRASIMTVPPPLSEKRARQCRESRSSYAIERPASIAAAGLGGSNALSTRIEFRPAFGARPRQRARPAAVLALLYPRNDQWHIPLILRPGHMVDHAGQVSLPGGAIEPGENARQAALREYSEELGVLPDRVRMLGPLSPLYLFASNYQIAPWVAALDTCPSFSPNAGEVDRVLEVPLAHFFDPANRGTIERKQRGLGFSRSLLLLAIGTNLGRNKHGSGRAHGDPRGVLAVSGAHKSPQVAGSGSCFCDTTKLLDRVPSDRFA